MIVISTRNFRANKQKFLDMANNGESVILRSREKGFFKLVPVSENDMPTNKKYILEPDADFEQTTSFDVFKEKVLNYIKELQIKELELYNKELHNKEAKRK